MRQVKKADIADAVELNRFSYPLLFWFSFHLKGFAIYQDDGEIEDGVFYIFTCFNQFGFRSKKSDALVGRV
jgi:hypothetical protein